MPHGKPAGIPCAQLDTNYQCMIFGKPERPAFCAGLQPNLEMCGETREYAIAWLTELELLTKPSAG